MNDDAENKIVLKWNKNRRHSVYERKLLSKRGHYFKNIWDREAEQIQPEWKSKLKNMFENYHYFKNLFSFYFFYVIKNYQFVFINFILFNYLRSFPLLLSIK